MATSMRKPVVVILGATGTGKTKLSIELARRFNGEIISADSMQVYKGLDVITNKATPEERRAVPHHLIDYISPLVADSGVMEYRDKAVPVIDSLLDKNKLPIIVGGTNYYIESLVWKKLIDLQDVARAAESSKAFTAKFPKLEEGAQVAKDPIEGAENISEGAQVGKDPIEGAENTANPSEDSIQRIVVSNEQYSMLRDKMERLTTPELYKQLMEFDKTKALKVHPNDRRKLLRALEVYYQFGVPMTDVYRAQHSEVGEEACSGPLRYPHTCMFWLQCDKEVLNQRLDARVDQMIEDGLLSELTEFHKAYNAQRLKDGEDPDYTTGIFQSIGFKEFHKYLMITEEERQTKFGQKVFEEGKENLKIATRRYARYQNKLVISRILKRKGPPNYTLPIYGLDCSDVPSWTDTVAKPAISILEAIIQGKKPEVDPINPDDYGGMHAKFVFNRCAACNRVFTQEHEYIKHQQGKSHKHWMKKYKVKLAELSRVLDKHADQLHVEEQRQSEEDTKTCQGSSNINDTESIPNQDSLTEAGTD